MEGTTEPIEMLTVSDDNVVVEEELTQRNGGWVISFTLTSKCERPVAVRVSVPMPDEPARQDVGFHPKHEPESWGLRNGILSFEDTVPVDEPLQILLGIVLVEDDDVTLSLSEPSIELSQPMDSDEDREKKEKAPIFRSSSVSDDDEGMVDIEEPAARDTTDPFSDSAMEAPSDTAETEPSLDDEISFDQMVTDTEEAETSAEGSDFSGLDIDKLREISEQVNNRQAADAEGGFEPESQEDELPSDDEEPSDGFFSQDADDAGPVETSENSGAVSPDETSVEATEDLLERLVERLESTDPDDEVIEVLRAHLIPESQRATDVRLKHIQSRMDDLAAYTEALEGLINEHGTASDFMAKVDDDIDDVRSQVKSLRREMDSAETEREDIREQVSEVDSTIEEVDEDLRGRTENIYGELDDMRDTIESREGKIRNLRESVNDHDDEFESLSSRVSTTEDQLEDHRDALDQRLSTLSNQVSEVQRTLESDYAELQEEVESLSEMREVFSRAFAGQNLDEDLEATEESSPDADETE